MTFNPNTDTGVVIGWPKEERGNGRLPKEFVVLRRVYPEFGVESVAATIKTCQESGRYRAVFFVPFDLEMSATDEIPPKVRQMMNIVAEMRRAGQNGFADQIQDILESIL